jgi:tetratricopeptide (TPR) repeat protein
MKMADFEELVRQATASREAGKTDDAIRSYESALKIRPDWPDGWWYLGTLNADAGHYSDAIAAFEKLLEANPSFGPGWASLGLCEFATKDYKSSLAHLKRAKELGFAAVPSLEKAAVYHLALLLNLNGAFEDAWELLASTFGKGVLAEQTKTALGLALLRVAVLPDQLDPSRDAVIDAAGETAALLVQGNFEQALPSFQRMLRLYPNTPFLHYAYGSALLFRQNYGEAEAQLLDETRITPQSALPHIRLAIIALKTHRAAEALPMAEHAAQLAPESAIAHEILGRVLNELGKTEQGAKQLANAEKLKPEKPQPDPQVARAYALQPVTVQARESVSARGNLGGSFEELVGRAEAARKARAFQQAISYYQRALELRPESDEAWSGVGSVYYAAGDYSQAIPALKNSVGINRKRVEAWFFLGLSEFDAKDYQNSYIHLERARELGYRGDPEMMALAITRLAELHNLNGDFFGAIDLLVPEARQNRLTGEMKLVLGMAMLRFPLLPDQAAASDQALLRDAGKTAALLYANKYDDTFRAFEQMLKKYPNIPFLHYAYAAALEMFSQHEEARAQLREEIRVNPRSALSYVRLASIDLKTNHPVQAVDDAKRAVDLDPQSAGGHEFLGRALLELGKIDAAVTELETASRLAPNYPEVHFNLARAYTKAKKPAQAAEERILFSELNADTHRENGAQPLPYGVPPAATEPVPQR